MSERIGKQQEVDIIEKWYDDDLTPAEKRLKQRSKSLHNFQLGVALKRMWNNSTSLQNRKIKIK